MVYMLYWSTVYCDIFSESTSSDLYTGHLNESDVMSLLSQKAGANPVCVSDILRWCALYSTSGQNHGCMKWFEHLFESSARAAERLQYEHLRCNFQQSLHSRDSPFHQRRRPRFFAATKCWTTSSLLSHFDADEKYIYI